MHYKCKKHWIISQLYIFEERCGIRNSYLFFRLKNKIMKNRKVEEDKRAQIALFSNTVQVKKGERKRAKERV